MKPLDLQVNGYAGTDFNGDDLTAEALHHACVCLREDDCDSILATFITDDVATLERRMSTLVRLREQDELARSVIVGIHIEGPFMNPEKGYIGAHPPQCVRPANLEDAKRLLDAAGGLTKIVTLAPEKDEHFHVTEFLANNGVTVSAGHCNPSLDVLRAATEHGLTMFTHVGNGCPMLMHRHDNIIQRALSLRDKLWLCFIPDGVHLPPAVLQNFFRAKPPGRALFTTDAMAGAGAGPGRYTIGPHEIEVGPDRIARQPGAQNFAGSTLTPDEGVRNIAAYLGLSPDTAHALWSSTPAAAFGVRLPSLDLSH